MKTRLNLTIEKHLMTEMKFYARKHQMSVSEIVESYFTMLTRHKKSQNIIDLIEALDKPAIDENADLKELYFRDKGLKYGS